MRGVRRDPEALESRILKSRAPLAGATILEIGSGAGRSARRYAGVAKRLVGIDPNRDEIARARRLTPARLRKRVRFEVAEAERLPFRDRSFDVVIFALSL